jgi:hypothetical protein
MDTASILVLAAIIGLLPAWIASRKGQSFFGWWVFGGLLFIVALPIALMQKDRRPTCPDCREVVHSDAVKCPHCQSGIDGRIVQYVPSG